MGIGNRLFGWLENSALAWGPRLAVWLALVPVRAMVNLMETLENDAREDTADIIIMLRDNQYMPAPVKRMLASVSGQPHFWHIFVMIAAAILMLPPMIFALCQPLARLVNYEQDRGLQSGRIDPASGVTAMLRDEKHRDLVESDLRDLGNTDERIEAYLDAARPVLSPAQVRDLIHRHPEDKAKYIAELRRGGWRDADIEMLGQIFPAIPPMPDMIRFADFGSFDERIIELWREYYDAPGWITEPMSLLGIAGEWANKYWFSHWRQPGRFELGEMHRRGQIDDETVKNAYLTQGFTPFWQDELLKLVANPLTRVDIRRMHAEGMLTDEELSGAYRAVGFYDRNNELMVEFTKRYNAEGDRDLTKTEILKAFKGLGITRAEATTMLGEINYGPDEIDFLLSSIEFRDSEEFRELTTSGVRQLYVSGIIGRTEVTSRLVAINYGAPEIAHLLDLWDLQAEPAIRKPTRSQLDKFLELGIIDSATWSREMALQGYSDRYTQWFAQALSAKLEDT